MAVLVQGPADAPEAAGAIQDPRAARPVHPVHERSDLFVGGDHSRRLPGGDVVVEEFSPSRRARLDHVRASRLALGVGDTHQVGEPLGQLVRHARWHRVPDALAHIQLHPHATLL